ncbi:quino protein amine dehydrogenase beta chain-like protein [Glonium stellatum]|uniref:Quino protein amine dehydrogenase beta chain-like protein n=1 Tax=Glonium stellatum TaxID=574774 RepID=A0A8E2FER2_9PEZI|nr:quino protein amine dehydrogenase beta chain-like protein [Glonium stellatum]
MRNEPKPTKKDLITTVHQFPNETWLENIAVRSNGQLLVTRIDKPELYQVDQSPPHGVILVHNFTEAHALGSLGIAEIEQDIFAVILGSWNDHTFKYTAGSYSVWRVDLRSYYPASPKVSKITDIPAALFLNGMTLLPGTQTVLISDSAAGVVYSLNTATGVYGIVLEDDTMKPIPGSFAVLGINGVRYDTGYLYYTNSFRELFCRVAVNPSGGEALGEYEILATGIEGDDFALAISEDGITTAYITGDPSNVLTRVEIEPGHAEVKVIAGNENSTIIAGDTSAAFGRTKKDKEILYVVTNGGIAAPVNGTFIEGGKVLAIQVAELD